MARGDVLPSPSLALALWAQPCPPWEVYFGGDGQEQLGLWAAEALGGEAALGVPRCLRGVPWRDTPGAVCLPRVSGRELAWYSQLPTTPRHPRKGQTAQGGERKDAGTQPSSQRGAGPLLQNEQLTHP